ncbi:MAG: response regulator [Oleispira sp.]|nr:response regulator [Oleispira sp.]MBL4881669.1 response regulator [Oleispira sp.]
MKNCPEDQLHRRIAELEEQVKEQQLALDNQQSNQLQSRRYQELVEHAPVCIHEIDQQGKLVKMNPAGLEMLGLTLESEVVNTPYLDFVGDANLGRIQGLMQAALKGHQASRFQFTVNTPAGDKTFESNFIPMPDPQGNISKLMGVTRDITLEQQSESHLIKAIEVAEHENLAKSKFMANISHELRTPINGILGASQILAYEKLTADQAEFVDIIHSSSDILLQLINDLLDISSLEVGKNRLMLKEVDLPTLMKNIFNMFRIETRQKSLSYEINGLDLLPTSAYIDGLRVTQVLQNVIGNAIKFTDQGRVIINLKTKPISANSFVFIAEIIDTGLGIPVSQQQEIFRSFTQLDMDISKRKKGSGLGLSICQKLCQLMSGSINVESHPGKGSTFTIELPLQLKNKNTLARANVQRQYDKRILLVEDNIVNQKVTLKLLQKLGLQVVVANNGQDALALCNKEVFDIILMDIQMPIMDGIQATEMLSILPNFNQAPIIALTASASQQEQLKYNAAGMSGLLAKPIRLETLIKEFDGWFNSDTL